MIKSTIVFVSLCFGVSLLVSCQSPRPTETEVIPTSPAVITKPSVGIQCKDPRSSICTKTYRPVCATRDTGVRCVTTPCPSTEKVTKGNACTACADEKVSSYVPGACS